jgi:glycyl-tRNA synthetase
VTALQRIERIVPAGTPTGYNVALLIEPAEVRLCEAVEALPEQASSNLFAYLDDALSLVDPVAAFFEDILVMAPEEDLRAARLGLLAAVRATAPAGIDWNALNLALGDTSRWSESSRPGRTCAITC